MGHREDLLAGARRCLEKRGYAHITARDLVAESGTNLASIGYHFGSKEALLAEAMEESFADWAQRVRELVVVERLHGAGPAEFVGAVWTAMLGSFAEYRGLAVAFVEAMAQAERHSQVREALAAGYAQTRATVAGMVRELLGAPAGPGDESLASLVIALFDGLLLQWLLDPGALPEGAEVAGALALIGGGNAPISDSVRARHPGVGG